MGLIEAWNSLIIGAGKQVFTFEDESNQPLLAIGAKPVKVEDIKEQY